MTETKSKGAIARIPALDGIRTLAVAAVFAYHAEAGWLPGGFLGVDVFFVLSGFLITSLLIGECRRSGGIDLPAFWLRRARRLLPAVVLVIAAVMLAAGITGQVQLPALRGNAIAGLFYFANWHQIVTHVSYFSSFGRPPLLKHLWSLSVEEQFYLCWPPILLLSYRQGGERRVLQVAVGLALLSAIELVVLAGSCSVTRIYEGTDTRATTLLVGAIAALWWSPQRMRAIGKRLPAAAIDGGGLLCLGALVYLMTAISDDTTGGLWPGLLAASVLATGVILAATDTRGGMGYLLSRKPMVWLGERSYGIYLWHWPVIVLTRSANAGYGESLQLAVLQAAITVALAAASYAALEQPVRRLGLRGYVQMIRRLCTAPFSRTQLARVTSATLIACIGLAGLGAGVFAQASNTASRSQTQVPTPPNQSGHGNTIITDSGRHQQPGAHTGSRRSGGPRQPGPGPGPRGRAKHAGGLGSARIPSGPTTVFGDSVVLGTETALSAALGPGTTFNAAIGRQPQATIAAVAQAAASHQLPQRVVISIGDNGLVTGQMLEYLRSVLPSSTEVVIVTPRVPDPWGPASAATIRGAKSWWPGLRVADWEQLSADENGWFNDGVHPDETGVTQFVRLIKETLDG